MTERMDDVTTETLERLADAFNAHDADAVMSFFAEDCEMLMPRGPDPWGRRLTGRQEVHEGGTGSIRRAPRRPLDGQEVEVRGCDLFEFRGDKIVRKDSYWKIIESSRSAGDPSTGQGTGAAPSPLD